MLDIKLIRENPDLIKENIKNRRMNVDVDKLLKLDEKNRELIVKIDSMRSELKSGSKSKPTQEEILKMKKLGDEIKSLDAEHENVKNELLELHARIPNLTHPSSPIGKDDSENVEIERVGEPTKFDFKPKDHLALGKDLDLLDFEAGAKVTGHGFYFFKNELVMLELALINYAFEKLISKGFTPIATPDLARGNVMSGTGYNPKGNEDQIYEIKDDDLSLIATSEITVGGYLSDTILSEDELDKKFVAFSHCFRKEAGAYGKESRGLYRVHQFSKVEMFVFCKPENSEKIHEEIKEIEKEIYTELEIPFRVVDICTGDMGGPAYKKYDLEGWMPMKNDWGEITSCSNCTDYQARRLNIKYKTKDGEKHYVHTLNGTAVTSSRVPLVILENYQQADGSVRVPEILQKYTGFKEIKMKNF